MPALVQTFNALPDQPRLPSDFAPNRWHIQIDSLEATLIISRMLLNGFLKPQIGAPPLGRPSSWFTNDEAFGQRVTGLLTRFGVQQESLLRMPVGGTEENKHADDDWNRLFETLRARLQ